MAMQIESVHACQSPTPSNPATTQAVVAKEMIVNSMEMLPRLAIINQGSCIF